MKADNFTTYLREAEMLQKISYQELKSMVVQYPYCQNLRYLLVTKSHQDDMNEYQTDLHLAATYSIDRNFLYRHLHQEAYTQTSTESLVLDNTVLEEQPKEVVELVETVQEPEVEIEQSLDLNTISERRTIRIQSENARLFAEQKAGLTDESIPAANLLNTKFEKKEIAEVEEHQLIEEIEGNDASDSIDEVPIEIEEVIEMDMKELETEMDEEASQAPTEAESITDRSDLITYIEKPETKKSRSLLDQLMKRNVVQEAQPEEEFFEESSDADYEDELESPPSPSEEQGETPPSNSEEPSVKEVLFEITNEMENEEKESFMEEITNDTDEDLIQELFEDPIDEADQGDEAPQEEMPHENEETPPEPVPKTSFKDWKEQYLPDPEEDQPLTTEISIEDILNEEESDTIDSVIAEEFKEDKKKKRKKKKTKKKVIEKKERSSKNKKEKKAKKKKKKRKIIDIAKKSIRENDDIISETLAELLAKQGSRKKAIAMYKRLSLIFPEKSSFFAEKIEKLKK